MTTTITIPATYNNGRLSLLRRPYFKIARKARVVFEVPKKDIGATFAEAAGLWADIDIDVLKKNIYEARKISTRRSINF